jgi:hypothetical protein
MKFVTLGAPPAPHLNLSPPRWRPYVISQRGPSFFADVKQLGAIIVALGFLFWVWFGVSNYTAPRPSYEYPAGMTYIGNGIYQLPDGTYTGNIPQGTDTSYWNNVVYPSGFPYGFSGGTMNNPTHYYNAITGAYGSLGGGEGGKQLITPKDSTSQGQKLRTSASR